MSTEMIPDEWVRLVHRMLERLETPEVMAGLVDALADRPILFGCYAVDDPDDADVTLARTAAIYENVPPGLWYLRDPDFLCAHIAEAIARQRGGGDESITPHMDDAELIAVGIIAAQICTHRSAPTLTTYAVDIRHHVYLRPHCGEPDAITEWTRLPAAPTGDTDDLWRAWMNATPPLTSTHLMLGRILTVCRMDPAECADIFGPPVLSDDEPTEDRNLRALAHVLAELDPYDPRNPARQN